MPGGFLLADDAKEAAQNSFDSWLKEQQDKAAQAAQAATQKVQTVTAPVTQGITDATQNLQQGAQDAQQRFDQWLAQQQQQQAQATAPAAAPTDTSGQSPQDRFDAWLQQQRQATQPAQAAVGSAVQGAQDLVSAGAQKVDQAVQGAQGGAADAVSQFGDPQLTADEAYAACGPAAAVRFAQMYGRNPTLREATNLAMQVGWTSQSGMAGISSEKALMDKLGVQTHIVGADWGAIAKEASTGNPVTISTPGHYFMADGYDQSSGAFHVGRSGLDLKGGTEWMTPNQMEGRMGALQGALFADNPTIPGRSASATPQGTSATPGDTGQPPNVKLDPTSPGTFYSSLAPAAQWIQSKTGINATAMLAIVANETGYGRSDNARDKNNLFSIQGDGSNGSRWASYSSPLDSFQAFADLIQKAPRYAQAWADRDDPNKFIDDLRNAGYVADEPGFPAQGWVDQVKGIIGTVPATVQQAVDTGRQNVQNAFNQTVSASGQVAQGAQNVMQQGQSQLDALRAQTDKAAADLKATQDAADQKSRAFRDTINQQIGQSQADLMASRDYGGPLRQAQEAGQAILNSGPARQASQAANDLVTAAQPFNQAPFGVGQPARQAVGEDFSRLGRDTQAGIQHAIANPLTPFITPGELGGELQKQFTSGVPAKLAANDKEMTDAAANALIAKARELGANPTPEQEQAVRTALSAFAPSTLPLMVVGGEGTVVPRVAGALGLTAASGAGMAAGEAVAPNLPEPLRPFAPLVGGLAAPLGAQVLTGLARSAISALRSTPGASVDDAVRQVVNDHYGQNLRDSSGNIDPDRVAQASAAVKARMEDLYRQAGEPMPETSLATREQPTVAPGGQRAPTPALPSPTRALAEPQPVAVGAEQSGIAAMGNEQTGIAAMASQQPTMGGGTVGISQTPSFLRESLRRMYPGALNKQAAKEGGQNLIDASREIPGAEGTISVDNTNKTISILDQGKGMTPGTMEDVFVKLGGSQKPAGAAGGMGTAIKAVMANAEDTWVRSISRDPDHPGQFTDSVMHGSGDDFLNGTMHRYYAKLGEMPDSELQGAPPEIHRVGSGPNGTGTLVWTKPMADVDWSPYALNSWISNFNRTSRIQGQTLKFVVDGQPVGPDEIVRGEAGSPSVAPIYAPHRPTEHLQTISVPGANIDFYGSKGTSETGYADVKLLNNGQYQADMYVQLPGNAKMPTTLVADIKSTVDPKSVGYPWTADRNNLIDTVQQSIKDYVSRNLAGTLIGKENERVGSTIRDAPMIGPVKLVDDARIGETSLATRLQEIPQEPHYKRLASAVQDLHDNLIAELEGRDIPAPGGSQTIKQSHLVGLGVSDKWLGLNVPPSYTPWATNEPEARGVLIEPWQIWHEVESAWGGATRAEQLDRFVDGLVATTLHEISHNTSVSGHEKDFAGILTRVPQFLGSRMHAAIVKSLKARLTPVWQDLVNDLSHDAQQFRSVASESGLGRYGEDLPAGPGGRPAIDGGNAVLPDQGGPGAGGSPGGPAVSAGGPLEGSQLGPQLGGEPPSAAMAAAQPPSGPGGPLVVRSGGVRAAQAAQTLQQSLNTIKPSRSQIAAATKDWLQLDRVGQRVSGLPSGVDTPRDLAALRVHIDSLVQAGVAGKDWYINSAHKILDAVGGDHQDAEKLAQLVGMMARNVNPDQNINYAIEAWNQWKSGIPVANVHRFGDVSREAADLLERNIPWDGRKTNSFYVNLMEELDPKLLAQKKATVDQWINRAYGYVTKAPSNAQYTFMENEMRRMAAARGERPSQVQAQMWVGQMALQAPNQKGEQDFSHALARRMGQVGIETDNPDLGRAFQDENGTDIVARAFGGLGGHSFEAPGGFQTQVAGALTPQTAPGGQGLRPASRATIEAIAAAKGHLLQLPSVGWTQVFPSTTAKDANAVDINAGRLLDPTEAQDLRAALDKKLSNTAPAAGEPAPYAFTPTERGAWLRNTSDLDNPQFRSAVDAALREVQYEGTWDAVPVRADSGRVTNDWSAQPDGQGFLETIRRGGREDAFRSIQDSLGRRIADARQSGASTATAAEPASAAGSGALPGAADLGPGPVTGPGAGFTGTVKDFLSGEGSEAGSAPVGAMLRGAQFAGGVAASEATQSDQDKQDPWGRFSRDVGVGLAAAAGPRTLAAIARGGGVNYSDLKAIRPPQQGTLLNAARRAQTPAEMVSAYTKQNLLSGIKTSVTNVISQLVELAKQPLGNLAAGHEEDAVAGVKAAGQAVPDAMRNFANTMRTGTTQFTTNTFPATSKFLPFFRLLSATDDFFRTLGWAMGAGQEGQRILRESGAGAGGASSVLGAAASRIDAAGQKAGRMSVFGEGGALGGDKISQVKQTLMASADYKKQALGLLIDQGIPFSSVPGRIWNTGLARLPGVAEIGAGMRFVQALHSGDAYAARQALGNMAVSSVISASIISNIANGNIRGPDDKEHPSGIRLNGQWYDYSNWGAWALPIALPAAWYEGIRQEGNKPNADYPKAVFNATSKAFESQFYAADIAKTLSQIGQGNASGVAGQQVSAIADRFLPLSGMLNNATQIWDPIMRDPSTKGLAQIWEHEQAKIPGLESLLPARPEMTSGQPQERLGSGPGQLIGMQTRSVSPLDATIADLERKGYKIPDPTQVPTEVNLRGSTIPLTEDEGRKLAVARGKLINDALGQMAASPGWDKMSDPDKALTLSRVMARIDSRNAALWADMTPSAEIDRRMSAGHTVVGKLTPLPTPALAGRR